MGYKQKPNKSVLKRFKVTATGKLKRGHCKTSHLMSARTSKTKRQLGRPALVAEGFARKLRKMACISGKRPNRTAAKRALAAKAKAKAAATPVAEAAK